MSEKEKEMREKLISLNHLLIFVDCKIYFRLEINC